MMAQPFAAHAGMGPGGHPGLPHGHPMAGMQHPGAGHMGVPNPAMMQGMHPGVSGPQVTQGPMVAGMPQGPVTSGPGGPMQSAHAMAHLGPQQPNPMFQQQNQQLAFAQLPPQQQQAMMRQRQTLYHHMQAQQQQGMGGMMQPQGNQMTPQHFAQLKANMNMPMQQQMQLQAQAQANAQNLQNQHQQRLIAQAHHQQQQQMMAQQHQQRNASQQMQLSRSQEQASQPPQSVPTPAPQNPTQMQQQQPVPPAPAPGAQPKQQQPPQANPQQQPQPTQVGTPQQMNDVVQVKQQDLGSSMNIIEDVPMAEDIGPSLNGHGILRLLMFQQGLCPNAPDDVNDLEYWERFVRNHFSPFGVLRQQLVSQKTGTGKIFQIQFASLARFYHAHFTSGVREMRMEPIGCTELKLPHGGCNVSSSKTYITYRYDNDLRVITEGSIQCNFDMANRIEHLSINTKAWTEYIPRGLWPTPDSLDQKSPKMSKNSKKPQKAQTILAAPSSCISDMGVPEYIIRFLEIAEVMMVMGPLMEFSQRNPNLPPRDAMVLMVKETSQNMRLNQMMASQNGGMQMNPGQRTPGLNGPNQFASPAMTHLGLPQQGSPHIGGPAHTPSPAHNMPQGGIAMVHQMSQGNSNLSGSQGASANTSPNVTTKRRRASQVKVEDESAGQEVNGANKVKPSPRIGGKRQKGTA